MGTRENTVVLITGASSGIGSVCADYLHKRGYRVYGTKLPHETVSSDSFELIPLNNHDEDMVTACVQHVLEREGRIDVLFNNAGFGIAGAIEESAIDEVREQMETNFYGGLRLCRAVLPSMRARKKGLIINTSSMAGLISIPFQGHYSASKYAIEGYSEALSMEVAPFGIDVALIEPADFKTGFTANRRWTRESENSAYGDIMKKAVGVMEQDEQTGPSPLAIALLLDRIILSPRPKLRYAVGPLSKTMVIPLKKIMPQRLFEWALMKYYKLH